MYLKGLSKTKKSTVVKRKSHFSLSLQFNVKRLQNGTWTLQRFGTNSHEFLPVHTRLRSLTRQTRKGGSKREHLCTCVTPTHTSITTSCRSRLQNKRRNAAETWRSPAELLSLQYSCWAGTSALGNQSTSCKLNSDGNEERKEQDNLLQQFVDLDKMAQQVWKCV